MGEMSYKCSQCKYTCTRVTNLHTHMLTHTEVRAFNCDQCIKIFTRKSYPIKHSLSQAQMYVHKEPTFLIMRSPWFYYHQRIWYALCLWHSDNRHLFGWFGSSSNNNISPQPAAAAAGTRRAFASQVCSTTPAAGCLEMRATNSDDNNR